MEAAIEVAATIFSATGETRNGTSNFADTWEIELAVRTFVKESSGTGDRREREIVRSLFVSDSEIDAGRPPFLAVGRDSATLRPKLCEQMRELVAKGAVDLARMFLQSGVERDQFVPEVGAPCAAF